MCKWLKDEVCVNSDCPAVADFCPVVNHPGVCRYEELDEYAPVRHGRWEAMHYEGGILDGTNFDKCSVCGYERIFEDEKLKTAFNYCPNCGARMDGE